MSEAKSLIAHSDFLFGKKKPFDKLCQEIAENFYLERADFTTSLNIGSDFGANLTTSAPVTARRDLANIFSGMLRPSDKQWFYNRIARMESIDNEGLRWLDWTTAIMTNAMYDPISNFVRATKEGDNDYAAFGQCVLSVELHRKNNALLYRNWHIRDCAWCENDAGKVNEIFRNWDPTVKQLSSLFNGKLSPETSKLLDKEPYKDVRVRHIVVPTDQYQSGDIKKKHKTPYISYFCERETNHIIEEIGINNLGYVVPRWQTVSGSQYAFSPSSVAALGDARLIQAMTLTLLEAGEKAVNPPMIGVQEALRSDLNIYAGGFTAVDSEYDERTGEVLRPLNIDSSGIPLGIEMQRDVRQQIVEAFYLNKIGLPPMKNETTAFEIGQRVSEYVRNALPLFTPLESEYNGGLCDLTFDVLMQNGAFGAPQEIPDTLRGQDIKFVFESPLAAAKEHGKAQRYIEAQTLLAQAAQIDPSVVSMLDVKTAVRDVLTSTNSPAKWLFSEEHVAEADEQMKQQQQAQQMMAQIQGAGAAAEQVGKGGKEITQMMEPQ